MPTSGYGTNRNAVQPAFNQYEVAVVGAGLVGAAVALGCAQGGIGTLLIGNAGKATSGAREPTVADAVTSHSSIGNEPWDRRVYAISPASRRFLSSLKVWPQIDSARITPIQDMRVFGASAGVGGANGALHFSSYRAACEALGWMVEHRELARALNAAVDFHSRITRVDGNADSFIGKSDRVEIQISRDVFEARLLVGADGAHSRVRKYLEATSDMRTKIRPYGQTGVVANFTCARPHGGTAYQWFTDDGVVALLPLPRQSIALVWSAPDTLARQLLDLPAAEVARRVELIAGGASCPVGTLTPISGTSGFPLELLETSSPIGPRMALVGDAAHVVHPLAGQGLNLGMQDAETLCAILARREIFRDCGDARLLRRYQRARLGPVTAMLRTTDGLQRLFATNDPVVRFMRNRGMNLVDGVPVIKDAVIRHAAG